MDFLQLFTICSQVLLKSAPHPRKSKFLLRLFFLELKQLMKDQANRQTVTAMDLTSLRNYFKEYCILKYFQPV